MYKFNVLLEGGFAPRGAMAGIGLVMLALACIGIIGGLLSLLIAIIIYFTKDKNEPNSPAYKLFIKLGVGGLLIGGVCFLLSIAFCSSH